MTKRAKKTIEEEIEEVIDALIKDVHYEHTYPAHTAYYQLDFDKLRNALKEFSQKLLQRFIEETKLKKRIYEKEIEEFKIDNSTIEGEFFERFLDGYNQALQNINQKQQQWLKENL